MCNIFYKWYLTKVHISIVKQFLINIQSEEAAMQLKICITFYFPSHFQFYKHFYNAYKFTWPLSHYPNERNEIFQKSHPEWNTVLRIKRVALPVLSLADDNLSKVRVNISRSPCPRTEPGKGKIFEMKFHAKSNRGYGRGENSRKP